MNLPREIRRVAFGSVFLAVLLFLSSVVARAEDRPKIPDHIKIGPYTYAVRVTAKMPCDCLGATYYDGLEIDIEADLPLDRERLTLFHEVAHAAMDVGTRAHDAKYAEDELFNTMLPTMIQTLRENPKLSDYLFR